MDQSELVNIILGDIGNRTDLTSDASAAVSSAVRYYNRERFYFLEGRDTFSLSSSTAYYDVPSDYSAQIDTMLITLSGGKVPLKRAHWSEIDEKDDGLTFGDPKEWCYQGNQIRVYPVPDASGVCSRAYHKTIDAPSLSGSNVWTQIAADLIRYRSDWDIAKHKLLNPDLASAFKQSEQEEYLSMMSETSRRISTGRIKKSGW